MIGSQRREREEDVAGATLDLDLTGLMMVRTMVLVTVDDGGWEDEGEDDGGDERMVERENKRSGGRRVLLVASGEDDGGCENDGEGGRWWWEEDGGRTERNISREWEREHTQRVRKKRSELYLQKYPCFKVEKI